MGVCVNHRHAFERHAAARRIFDICVGTALLPIAAPLCVALMIAIRLESKGSPLFTQTRVGRGEEPFKMFKLRTMRSDTGDLPSHEVSAERITRIGRILRKLKLDELPQLANVIAGSMSFVGPRPCLPIQRELIEARRRHALFGIRPGITGPAQVAGVDMSEPQRLADTEASYFHSASFDDDVVLLMRTFVGAGSGDAATKPTGKHSSKLPE